MGLRNFTIDVKRPGPSTTDPSGVITPGTPSTFQIKCSVQPLSKIQQENNEFLRDFQEVYKIFTSTELVTAVAGSNNSDIVTLFGKDYEVISSQKWQNRVRSHYEVLAAR